jgi:hypothetical protein
VSGPSCFEDCAVTMEFWRRSQQWSPYSEMEVDAQYLLMKRQYLIQTSRTSVYFLDVRVWLLARVRLHS